MPTLRYYLDENVETAVALQLRARQIDVITAREAGALGEPDTDHLARATASGRVLCSYDNDYRVLASSGIIHAGIIIGNRRRHSIGHWVRALELCHAIYTSDDFSNRLEYLSDL